MLDNNIFNYVSGKELKRIIPDKEIKPITYQIKSKQYIYIDEFAKIESSNNNLTFFFSNKLKIERFYKEKQDNDKETTLNVKENEDIVISGLGFIKVTKEETIKIYTKDNIDVYIRKSLI